MVGRYLSGPPLTFAGEWPWRRVRLAVTKAEYDELAKIAGREFAGRVKGIQLVIDENPEQTRKVDAFDNEATP